MDRDSPTRSPFRPAEVEALAKRAGVSLERDWRPDVFFLSLYDRVSLDALAAEWKLADAVPASLKSADARGALLEAALAAKVGPPKALLAAKPRS